MLFHSTLAALPTSFMDYNLCLRFYFLLLRLTHLAIVCSYSSVFGSKLGFPEVYKIQDSYQFLHLIVEVKRTDRTIFFAAHEK